MSKRHSFKVDEASMDQRLDRALAAIGPWSRSHAAKLIAGGRVTVGETVAKPSRRLKIGELIVVDEPDPTPIDLEAEELPLSVLYEDEHLLVIDKQPGLIIHPAAGNPSGTLVNALLHHCGDSLSGIGGKVRPGIVHRLDKDTTGALIVAKSNSAHQRLALDFRWKKIDKTYLAVCYGELDPSEGNIEAPIGRHPKDRKKMAVVESGRASRTRYRTDRRLDGCSLVACTLITGRTHQIRVHMAHIGHPLVGDQQYSGKQWKQLSSRVLGAARDFPRQALHAWRIGFTHPIDETRLEIEAPIPADLQGLIEKLEL